ncbi:ImmA/IrrE family metallo-endopeptidase [Lachnospiraceae bacterium JLR.KK008]
MKYEELLEESAAEDVYIIENADFKSKADGLINGNVIGINKKVRTARKRTCILAEELGHYHTTVGDIVCQSTISDRKQELKARVWAYNKLIGLTGIVNSYQQGCCSLHDTADFLDVTEEFLLEALQYYKSKYGIYTTIDNYVIYFEPSLGVFELV